jgi:hypothetical protein
MPLLKKIQGQMNLPTLGLVALDLSAEAGGS